MERERESPAFPPDLRRLEDRGSSISDPIYGGVIGRSISPPSLSPAPRFRDSRKPEFHIRESHAREKRVEAFLTSVFARRESCDISQGSRGPFGYPVRQLRRDPKVRRGVSEDRPYFRRSSAFHSV